MKRRFSFDENKWPIDENGQRVAYWDYRRELIYYSAMANFIRIIGDEANSLIDVGSAGCKYISWFDWIEDRVSLDLEYPARAQGVRSIKADFFSWEADKIYDVVVCSQVLEHIADAPAFAKKLLSIGRRVLITVPHMWPAKSIPSHIHDPVSLEDVQAWCGRKPTYSMTVREPFGEERLFCYYSNDERKIDRTNSALMAALLSHPIDKN